MKSSKRIGPGGASGVVLAAGLAVGLATVIAPGAMAQDAPRGADDRPAGSTGRARAQPADTKAAALQPPAAGRAGIQPGAVNGVNAGTVVNQPGMQAGGAVGAGAQPDGAGLEGEVRPARPRVEPLEEIEPGPDEIVLSDFRDGVQLRALVEYIAEVLNINVAGSDALTEQMTISLLAPMVIKKDRLLTLLDSLLENQGFTIVPDPMTGWYFVLPVDQVRPNLTDQEGELSTTRVVPTPTIRPSSLKDAIDSQLGVSGKSSRLAYLDDLGVIIVTDSPRRIDNLVALVETILAQVGQRDFTLIELTHVAASVARTRVIELLGGQASNPFGVPGQPAVQPGGVPGSGISTGSLSNIADRLIVNPQGNSLIFRGYASEIDAVRKLVAVLDQPNTLEYRSFYAGTSAVQIAQIAEKRGLGAVEVIDTTPVSTGTGQQNNNPFQTAGQRAQQAQQVQFQGQGLTGQAGASTGGGPVMVVDQGKGTIIYYGTPAQQKQLGELIRTFDTEQDLVVVREYTIKNRSASDIADVLLSLSGGGAGTDTSSPFFGGGFGAFQQQFNRNFGTQQNQNTRTGTNRNTRNNQTGTGTGTNRQTQGTGLGTTGTARGLPGQGSLVGGAEVFIVADQGKNQVLVRAPVKQQEEFARLIAKLDQRRPQVFLEVQIVSVSSDDTLRVTVENQLINAGGTGGALNSNFGVGTLPTTGQPLVQRKTVSGALQGFTAALIKNDQVPIVINAIKRVSDTRILSSPQLLVDDNETASIFSVDQQPTTTTNIGTGGQNNTVTFNGYEEAGTQLEVTPSISEGGYLRLQYAITLSNFVGTGSNGLPPPKQERTVESNSVTLPSDSTIVVGGIKVDADSNTKARIPIVGEIPFIGWLFGDSSKQKTSTRLYIFITPRIMRDQNFRDLLLYTRGPQAEAGIALDVPNLTPEMVQLVQPVSAAPAGAPALAPEPVRVEPTSPPPAPPLKPEPAPVVSAPKPQTQPQPAPGGTVRRRPSKEGPSPDD